MSPLKRAVVAQRPSRCFSRFFVSLHTLAGALATAMPRPQRKASASAKYTVDPPSDDEGDDEVREVKAGVRKGKRRANGAADEGQDTDWKAGALRCSLSLVGGPLPADLAVSSVSRS